MQVCRVVNHHHSWAHRNEQSFSEKWHLLSLTPLAVLHEGGYWPYHRSLQLQGLDKNAGPFCCGRSAEK